MSISVTAEHSSGRDSPVEGSRGTHTDTNLLAKTQSLGISVSRRQSWRRLLFVIARTNTHRHERREVQKRAKTCMHPKIFGKQHTNTQTHKDNPEILHLYNVQDRHTPKHVRTHAEACTRTSTPKCTHCSQHIHVVQYRQTQTHARTRASTQHAHQHPITHTILTTHSRRSGSACFSCAWP